MREYEEKAKHMKDALRSAGSRITPQRKAIIHYLVSVSSHPSARQIYNDVKRKHPALSFATVYNTLGVLVRMRLIKVMQFDVRDNRYEPNVAPHINLICTSCGKITDLEQGISVKPEEVKEKVGFEVLESRLEYYGFCAECKTQG